MSLTHRVIEVREADGEYRFPKQPKAALRDTLDTFAERIGAKEAEKRWVLRSVPEL